MTVNEGDAAWGSGVAVVVPLAVAAVAGCVHGLFSLYWAAGGDWLLATLGHRLVTTFAGVRWVLVPVGVAKLVAAVAPAVLARRGWPARRASRGACWLVAGGLLLWGGVNTVVGQLVLAGIIRTGGGYDHDGMVGHAWLWDPLFALWGLALGIGLALTRRTRPDGVW
jgi:hypothetical protein